MQFVAAHSAVDQLDHPVLAADEAYHRLSLAEVDFSVCFGCFLPAEELHSVGHLLLHPDSSSLRDKEGKKWKISSTRSPY